MSEENGTLLEILTLKISVKKLKNVDDAFGKSATRSTVLKRIDKLFELTDPFFEVLNSANEVVGRSKVLTNSLNPDFPELHVDLQSLGASDSDPPIYISFYNWEKSGKHQFLGRIPTTISELEHKAETLSTATAKTSTLGRKNKKDPSFELSKDGKPFGDIYIENVQIGLGIPSEISFSIVDSAAMTQSLRTPTGSLPGGDNSSIAAGFDRIASQSMTNFVTQEQLAEVARAAESNQDPPGDSVKGVQRHGPVADGDSETGMETREMEVATNAALVEPSRAANEVDAEDKSGVVPPGDQDEAEDFNAILIGDSMEVDQTDIKENLDETTTLMVIGIKASDLKATNGLSEQDDPAESTPLSRLIDPPASYYEVMGADEHVVARSSILVDDLHPTFPPVRVPLDALCPSGNDDDAPVCLRFYNWEKDGNDQYMSSVETTVGQLQEEANRVKNSVRGADFGAVDPSFSLKEGTTHYGYVYITGLSFEEGIAPPLSFTTVSLAKNSALAENGSPLEKPVTIDSQDRSNQSFDQSSAAEPESREETKEAAVDEGDVAAEEEVAAFGMDGEVTLQGQNADVLQPDVGEEAALATEEEERQAEEVTEGARMTLKKEEPTADVKEESTVTPEDTGALEESPMLDIEKVPTQAVEEAESAHTISLAATDGYAAEEVVVSGSDPFTSEEEAGGAVEIGDTFAAEEREHDRSRSENGARILAGEVETDQNVVKEGDETDTLDQTVSACPDSAEAVQVVTEEAIALTEGETGRVVDEVVPAETYRAEEKREAAAQESVGALETAQTTEDGVSALVVEEEALATEADRSTHEESPKEEVIQLSSGEDADQLDDEEPPATLVFGEEAAIVGVAGVADEDESKRAEEEEEEIVVSEFAQVFAKEEIHVVAEEEETKQTKVAEATRPVEEEAVPATSQIAADKDSVGLAEEQEANPAKEDETPRVASEGKAAGLGKEQETKRQDDTTADATETVRIADEEEAAAELMEEKEVTRSKYGRDDLDEADKNTQEEEGTFAEAARTCDEEVAVDVELVGEAELAKQSKERGAGTAEALRIVEETESTQVVEVEAKLSPEGGSPIPSNDEVVPPPSDEGDNKTAKDAMIGLTGDAASTAGPVWAKTEEGSGEPTPVEVETTDFLSDFVGTVEEMDTDGYARPDFVVAVSIGSSSGTDGVVANTSTVPKPKESGDGKSKATSQAVPRELELELSQETTLCKNPVPKPGEADGVAAEDGLREAAQKDEISVIVVQGEKDAELVSAKEAADLDTEEKPAGPAEETRIAEKEEAAEEATRAAEEARIAEKEEAAEGEARRVAEEVRIAVEEEAACLAAEEEAVLDTILGESPSPIAETKVTELSLGSPGTGKNTPSLVRKAKSLSNKGRPSSLSSSPKASFSSSVCTSKPNIKTLASRSFSNRSKSPTGRSVSSRSVSSRSFSSRAKSNRFASPSKREQARSINTSLEPSYTFMPTLVSSPMKFSVPTGDVFERLYARDIRCLSVQRINPLYYKNGGSRNTEDGTKSA